MNIDRNMVIVLLVVHLVSVFLGFCLRKKTPDPGKFLDIRCYRYLEDVNGWGVAIETASQDAFDWGYDGVFFAGQVYDIKDTIKLPPNQMLIGSPGSEIVVDHPQGKEKDE